MTMAKHAARSARRPRPSPGNLRKRRWNRFLRGSDSLLLEELYVPALAEAVRYDRCCAYFSSTVLSAAARGFAKLIERLIAMGERAPRPAVRLIVNEQLDPADVRAMVETGDVSRLEAALLKRFKNPRDLLEKKRLGMLGWLVQAGLLEVRVGVMRQGTGILHAKFGIIRDESGNAVVFNGSGNESAQALTANYERLDVATSWQDPEYYQVYADEFERLWRDEDPAVHTVTLPEALRLKLIKFAPQEPPTEEPSTARARQTAAMIWRFIVEAPYLPDGETSCDATAMVDLWPHQQRVVQEVTDAWPDGRLLCDEVGMGKTIEAILILRRLLAGRGVQRALLLVPKGLLEQWQAELREKGGLIIPRLRGTNSVAWPDGQTESCEDLLDALNRYDVLLVSRETARTERNQPIVLRARPWDLVLLDEAHAARRREPQEGGFNKGNLLLELLRRLQLRRRTRSILLLSATPMQLYPWEPWDLLAVLGEGGLWLADFRGVRDFYKAITDLQRGACGLKTAKRAAKLVANDPRFPDLPGGRPARRDADSIAERLTFAPAELRTKLVSWLRAGSPLSRRMHRNTRGTLRYYHELGLIERPPPVRSVLDVDFDYEDKREREVYDAITAYIDRRFQLGGADRTGKGLVRTVYRRRASSSPRALQESLERRRKALERVAKGYAYHYSLPREDLPEALQDDDLPEGCDLQVSAALPEDPETARAELREVENLLEDLANLGTVDSKRDKFFELLRSATEDGRSALVFTEYVDTMEYLRDLLRDQKRVGSFSGDGGRLWDGSQWKAVSKDAITATLREGKLDVLVCTDAASEGLNLQAAGAVINYDLPWNPSKVEQRIGRIDRIGQTREKIWIVNLYLRDSVDERVYKALRRRCRLFEDFVGCMQPVLARARQMLISGERVDLEELEKEARRVERDPIARETYLESDEPPEARARPAITRQNLEEALRLLDGTFEFRARQRRNDQIWEVSGPGLPRSRFTASVRVLEGDQHVRPLSPLEPKLRLLADKLQRAGERLPLVVCSQQQGPFRASVAYWVRPEEVVPVEDLGQLRRLIEAWDGAYPSQEDWKRAEEDAARRARERVERQARRAAEKEQNGRALQLEAVRIRLLRELGRYLACMTENLDGLNEAFREQMSRDGPVGERLRRCYAALGSRWPEWSDDLREELREFVRNLTRDERQARLAASELDAALEDPRWQIADGRGSAALL